MGEHILKALANELSKVRITCSKCGAIAELPADNIMANYKRSLCPFCGVTLPEGTLNALADLQAALSGLRNSDAVTVEFPIKLDGQA